MRFCPFCSAENADELAVCQACGRRLPPLPPRRARNAPPTGVQLPRPTPSAAPPTPSQPMPRPKAPSQPPPTGDGPRPSGFGPRLDTGGPITSPGVTPARTVASRESAPALPPPPPSGERQAILDALSPSPAAERREPAPPPGLDGGRRRSDSNNPPMRPASASWPPPVASQPPPPAEVRAAVRPKPEVPAWDTSPTGEPLAPPLTIESSRQGAFGEPPPTRLHRSEALVDRPFAPPRVLPVPEIPEPGLVNAARYAVRFGRARWQRRGAIKQLGLEIKQDTEALDQVLGALGKTARGARVEGRVFSAENSAINGAEERIATLQKDAGEVEGRKAEENSRFVDVERERNEKLTEAERMVDEAQRELANLEGQRRSLRDKRKELERRQKAYLKAADDNERQASSSQMGDQRQDLRRAAEGHRKEAAALEPDRQEIDRRLGALERPISEATAKLDAAKAELDAAKRSLNDAREGHTHRLAELDSEHKRKSREMALAESEIQRRLVTLGTLVNLNRIEDPQFSELYQRIDRLRGAITARTTEIEKLTAEREAFDRGTAVRGVATIGVAFVSLIALIVILRAIL